MDEITDMSIKAVYDGLKDALDRVCGPKYCQIDTTAVLISAVIVAVHELRNLLSIKKIEIPRFEAGNSFL